MSLTHTIEASPPAAPICEPKTKGERSSVADQQQKEKTPATDGYGGSVAGAVRRREAGGLSASHLRSRTLKRVLPVAALRLSDGKIRLSSAQYLARW
jgi:hypothetical protein